jgi:hypothetical protein
VIVPVKPAPRQRGTPLNPWHFGPEVCYRLSWLNATNSEEVARTRQLAASLFPPVPSCIISLNICVHLCLSVVSFEARRKSARANLPKSDKKWTAKHPFLIDTVFE